MAWSSYTEAAAEARGREDATGRWVEEPGPAGTSARRRLPPYPPTLMQGPPQYLGQARASAAREIVRIEAKWLKARGDIEVKMRGLRGDRRDLPPRAEIDAYRNLPRGLNFALYALVVVVATISEFFLLLQVFQIAGKEAAEWQSYLLPAGLGIALPFAAHFVGEDWQILDSPSASGQQRRAARFRMAIIITVIAAAQIGASLFRFAKYGYNLKVMIRSAGMAFPGWVWIVAFLAFQAALFMIMVVAAHKYASPAVRELQAKVREVDSLEEQVKQLGLLWSDEYQKYRGQAQEVIGQCEVVYVAYTTGNSTQRPDPPERWVVPEAVTLPASLRSETAPGLDSDLEGGSVQPSVPQGQSATGIPPASPSPAPVAAPIAAQPVVIVQPVEESPYAPDVT